MAILSERLCADCKRKLHRHPEISGDYDEDGRLLSFCPVCGKGFPALSTGFVVVRVTISKRKLKILVSRTATKFGLSYHDLDELVNTIKNLDRNVAFSAFRNEISKKYRIELPPEIFSGI